MHEHADPHRVAEVIAGSMRGSGYRVGDTAILTAAHVVQAGAAAIVVRCDAGTPGEWSAPATVSWSDPDGDLAILEFVPPQGAPASVKPVRYGALADRRAVIAVHALGFPRFKRRSTYRDLHDAAGTLALLSNRRSGTLEVTVTPPAADPDGLSPWEGMSGAALWADGRIIGVIAAHHPREGLGRLTAARVDRALAPVDDILGGPPGWMSRSGYVEQVRDIAPAGGLKGREAELDELASFCAGDESYVYWQAEPWAGKSALMSTFVLHPPDGVDIVSFFVTARLATQADSNAFTEALVEQLSHLVGEEPPPTARDHHRRALLRAAAEKCRRAGRRLVLVVDGMDEDTGAVPGRGLASIASLLPKSPDDGVRIILAGRPAPPIPGDVAEDHPLRSCRIRRLAVSPHATHTARMAHRELDELLTGDHAQREVIGLITASGGGLSLPELEELTRLPRFDLDRILGGVFGRTIAARGDVFLFTHDTLRVEAISRLGTPVLDGYRKRFHEWAVHYGHWPADTPAFLLRGYPRMLYALGDAQRLVALATDRARHERLLEATGGDGEALTDIALAQGLSLDTVSLARLAVHRQRLGARNANVPTELPRLWAMLGQPQRAESLARSIASPRRRAAALTTLIPLVDAEPAIAAAQLIPEPDARHEALVRVVEALVGADLPDAAEAAAREIAHPDWREMALTAVVGVLDRDRAHGLAASLSNPYWQARSLAVLGLFDAALGVAYVVPDPYWRATAFGAIGATALAIDVAATVPHPYWRSKVLCGIASRLEPAARQRASALAAAVAAAGQIYDPPRSAQAFIDLVAVARAAGDDRRVACFARVAVKEASQVHGADEDRALVALAVEVARGGTPDRIAAALPVILRIRQPAERARARVLVGGPLPALHARLIEEATGIAEPRERASCLTVLGLAKAESGDHAGALALARRATALLQAAAPGDTDALFSPLARALVEAGELERAEAIGSAITDGQARLSVLAALRTGQGRYEEADVLVRRIDDAEARVRAWIALTRALTRAGRDVEARQCVESAMAVIQMYKGMSRPALPHIALTAVSRVMPGPPTLYDSLLEATHIDVAEGYALVDDPDAALSVVGSTVPGGASRLMSRLTAKAIGEIVKRLVEAGEPARARALADLLPTDEDRAEILLDLAQELIKAGRPSEAAEVVHAAAEAGATAYSAAVRISILGRAARAWIELGEQTHAVATLRRVADVVAVSGRVGVTVAIRILLDMAATFGRSGQRQPAVEALEIATDAAAGAALLLPVPRSLGGLVLAWFRLGERERAAALLESGVEQLQRVAPRAVEVSVLASLAEGALALGRREQARDLLEAAAGTASLFAVADSIATARGFYALGDRGRAGELLEQAAIVRRTRGAEPGWAVVGVMFQLGEPERARRAFHRMLEWAKGNTDPVNVLRGLAASMVEVGEVRLALLAVETIADPDTRRRVLAELEPAPLAAALETLSWEDTVEALARWDAPALAAIADEVMAVNPSMVDGP